MPERGSRDGGLCLKESLELAPALCEHIPEAGCEVTGCFWCLEHPFWVYRQSEQLAEVNTVRHALASTALQRLRLIREAGLAFTRLRTDATQALTEQELKLRRELELQQESAIRAAVGRIKVEADVASQQRQFANAHDMQMVELYSSGPTEQVLQEARKEVQLVRLEAQGLVSGASGENQQLVSLSQTQEARLQKQAPEMDQMGEWMDKSFAEARARVARIEASTEEKIQEAVEIERRTARAFSEERRPIYSEQVERRLREELHHEFRREATAAATALAIPPQAAMWFSLIRNASYKPMR
jgi:hypothetical protein